MKWKSYDEAPVWWQFLICLSIPFLLIIAVVMLCILTPLVWYDEWVQDREKRKKNEENRTTGSGW